MRVPASYRVACDPVHQDLLRLSGNIEKVHRNISLSLIHGMDKIASGHGRYCSGQEENGSDT